MAVQIGAKPDSGFDDPLGMLMDCHRRIEHFLSILCVVAERANGRALTREEAEAVEAALTYFQVGGQRHTADEEESLFPRLVGMAEFSELDRLEHDHADASALHKSVEDMYRDWIHGGVLEAASAVQLHADTKRLREIYEAHIEVEDKIVFPRAARTLGTDDIAAIGREFRDRRQ